MILVVDARGQSHSIAALLHGFSTFDHRRSGIAGVILNRVGSPRHEEVLRQACEHAGVPVLGAIPRADELSVPSRHLGLVTAVEHGEQARVAVEAMIELVGRHVDLVAVSPRSAASRVTDEPWDPAVAAPTAADVTVALAAGKAFSFGYTEHGELLRAAGAEVVEFDPLTDPLPPRTAALVLPGGFPEQFSTELSTNDVVRQQIHDLAAGGAPIHAECAGLTYLVDDLDGYPMCGVLSGSARFTDRLTLGYREAVAVADSSLHAIGERAVGHEFHRTTVTFADSYPPAWVYAGRDMAKVRDGAVDRRRARVISAHPSGRAPASGNPLRCAARAAPQPLSSPGDRERLPRRPAPGRQEGRRRRWRYRRAAPPAAVDRQRCRRARHHPQRHPGRRGA